MYNLRSFLEQFTYSSNDSVPEGLGVSLMVVWRHISVHGDLNSNQLDSGKLETGSGARRDGVCILWRWKCTKE